MYALLEQCKWEEKQCDPFIRCVQGAPDAMCVLATDGQLYCVYIGTFYWVGWCQFSFAVKYKQPQEWTKLSRTDLERHVWAMWAETAPHICYMQCKQNRELNTVTLI